MKAAKKLLALGLALTMGISFMACNASVGGTEESTETSSSTAEDPKTLGEQQAEKELEAPAMIIDGEEVSRIDYQYMLDQYSQGVDLADAAAVQEVKDSINKQFIESEAMVAEGKKNMTDEQKEQFQQDFDAEYSQYWEQFRQDAVTALGEGASEEDIKAYCEGQLEEMAIANGTTVAELKSGIEKQLYYDVAVNNIYDKIEVTDEEAKKWYDDQIIAKRQEYVSNPTAFEADYQNGTAVLIPENYGFVKHVLIKFDEAGQAKYDEYSAAMQEAINEQAQLKLSFEDYDQVEVSRLDGVINENRQKIIDECYTGIMSKAEEVLGKAKAGDDFDALIAEYGEDEGSTQEPYLTDGYMVGPKSQLYPEFKAASLAMKNEGDIAGPIRSQAGLHIIKRVKNLTAGEIPFEDIADMCKEQAKETKKMAAVTEEMTRLGSEAKVEDNTASIMPTGA